MFFSGQISNVILQTIADLVFSHLDEEVHDITGQSLKAAGLTLQELKQIPM